MGKSHITWVKGQATHFECHLYKQIGEWVKVQGGKAAQLYDQFSFKSHLMPLDVPRCVAQWEKLTPRKQKHTCHTKEAPLEIGYHRKVAFKLIHHCPAAQAHDLSNLLPKKHGGNSTCFGVTGLAMLPTSSTKIHLNASDIMAHLQCKLQ